MSDSIPSTERPTLLVFDFKSRVDPEQAGALIAEIRPDACFAMTPEAAWQFESRGVDCVTPDAEFDYKTFSDRGRELHGQLRGIFSDIFGEDANAYLASIGFPINLFLDVLLQEDQKWKRLQEKMKSHNVELATDIPAGEPAGLRIGWSDEDDFRMHRVCLYALAFSRIKPLRHVDRIGFEALPQRSVSRDAIQQASLIGGKALKALKRGVAPVGAEAGPVEGSVLTNCGPIVARLKLKFSKGARIVSADELDSFYRERHKSFAVAGDGLEDRLADAVFRQAFGDLSEVLKAFAAEPLKEAVRSAREEVEFWKSHGEEFQRSHNIRYVLSSGHHSGLAIFSALMKGRIKTVSLPHSPLFHDGMAIDMIEGRHAETILLPARHRGPFLREDVEFKIAGHPNLSGLPKYVKGEPGAYLYLMYNPKGHVDYVNFEAPAVVRFDGCYLFRRHKAVIDLFAGRKERLYLRPLPGFPGEGKYYEPIFEYLRSKKAANILVDQRAIGAEYFLDYECALFDYMMTGFTEALLVGTPRILGCIGPPVEITNGRVREAIKQTAACADNCDDFVAAIRRELDGDAPIPKVDRDAARRFLEEFSVLPISRREAEQNLIRALFGDEGQ